MWDTLLPAVWFALWGLLWAIYFALDGFDLGAGMLAGALEDPEERSMLARSLGPFWDGNEVWLITAGGVTFAAFPKLYAVMFSSLYGPLMLVLVALVLRAVAIEFFHLNAGPAWRQVWTRILGLASLAAALLFGVAFGNIFQGLPLDAAGFHGNLLTLLNPYGVLTGVLFVLAFLMNGSAWLAYRAITPQLRDKGMALARGMWPLVFAAAALWLAYTPVATGLLGNYLRQPLLFALPLAAVAALLGARLGLRRGQPVAGLASGSLAVLLTVLSGVAGLFPAMFPSRIDPAYSLTAYNAASSPLTLRIMLVVTLIFLPLVLVYQAWFYRVFAPPAEAEDEAEAEEHGY